MKSHLAANAASMRLCDSITAKLPAAVQRPRYDRDAVQPGIAHLSVGAFHRAHQAVYLDDLLNRGGERCWGVAGVGLLPGDCLVRDALDAQDLLYTVLEKRPEGVTARVVGSLVVYHFAPERPQAVVEALADPDIRIVTLTITEGGYCLDEETGELNTEHPALKNDLSAGTRPVTALGLLCSALALRRSRGFEPFTVLSCDNLQCNGQAARSALLGFAALKHRGLADWLAEKCAFPNSMVDRITPAATASDRAITIEQFGYEDNCPVVTESFRQWVIEDDFCCGRPAWEEVGVQMTDDVAPYEKMKIRLLNASHSSMGYLGYLAGFRCIDEVIADSQFNRYIVELMEEEVTPLLDPIPGLNLGEYKMMLLRRFSNSAMKDNLLRICRDGSAKIPKFILPSIREQLVRGGSYRRLALTVAAWLRFLAGEDERGATISIEDPLADMLQRSAAAGRADARGLLALERVFGSLGAEPRFQQEVCFLLRKLYAQGARETLAWVLQQSE